ncbi:MAG: hypothetical protein JW861_11830, partial [Bacteroidales bacterium]|nr:hypothetical protein [Bacteroidales bacterium]
MKKNLSLIVLVLMMMVLPNNIKSQDLETDSLALVALYNDCNGVNWNGFDSWLSGGLSTWEDVTVAEVEGA